MPFAFDNLEDRTRGLMLGEVDLDKDAGVLYTSDRLTDVGVVRWETLLRDACETGDDASLAAALGPPGGLCLRALEPNPRSPAGDDKAVPRTAHVTLAEGEFNRFYIRAMCVRATEDGVELEICRARASANPDARSQARIGQSPDAAALLADLRANVGVATALGLPPHPNSGLSVRLKR